MLPARLLALLLAFAVLTTAATASRPEADRGGPVTFRAMAWNIWLGGRGAGRFVGPRRVIDVIKESRADLVLMQETYGSGELIAKGTGLHFLARGTNVSIFSRFPILEDVSVFEPFKCVGAIVRLPNGSRVAVYSIWLPYGEDIWIPEIRKAAGLERMLAACQPSANDLEKMLAQIDERLSGPEYAGIPVVIAGDFNSMSHIDYGEIGREHYERAIDWPTSRLMTSAGYRDAFREAHPAIDRAADRTWSPQFPEQEQERIDFVYFRGRSLRTVSAERIDSASVPFPSDHAAVVAELRHDPRPRPAGPVRLRAATYNIRHGRGMDDGLDLDRTAQAIRALRADVVALQEVDDRTKRSGGVNQAAELGKEPGMHAFFGSFMEYDGGQYGMAVLSRYPVVGVRALRLPDGNEPRIALFVELRLPSDETVTVVNVHFDWVSDDAFRIAQAVRVAEAVRALETPFLLLGDFNDGPDSRTLAAFLPHATEAAKPTGRAATFPASKPTVEIDYLFAGPVGRWGVGPGGVVAEPLASDHRPVVADFVLIPVQPRTR